jgi:hypothetical protein
MNKIENSFRDEGWMHENLLVDLKSKEVRRGKCDLGDIFYVFHYNLCTVDLTYNIYTKTLTLKVFGENESNAKKVYETLDKKINEYSKEYSDPTGIQKQVKEL